MAISKIVYSGNTLIDLTGDTVTADTLLSGITAHDKSGNQITGVMTTTGGITIDSITTTMSSSTTGSFTGLKGTPKFAIIRLNQNISLSRSYRYIVGVSWDGQTAKTNYSYMSSYIAGATNTSSSVTVSYNSGTLTITTSSSSDGQFYGGSYELIYGY